MMRSWLMRRIFAGLQPRFDRSVARIDTRQRMMQDSAQYLGGPPRSRANPRRGGGLMGRFSRNWGVALVVAALLLASSGLLAQDVGGTIFGRVGDESGKALAAATVSARNLNTGPPRVA